MIDELDEPLGRKAPQKKPLRRALSARALATGGALLLGVAATALVYMPRDPFAGEPHAVARIESDKAPADIPTRESARNEEAQTEPRDQVTTAAAIEEQSGVKVTRSGAAEGSRALIIQIEPPSSLKLPLAPDRRVTEKGPYGPLPKTSSSGAKPMHIYARPFRASPKLPAGAPRLALIVGGVGLNAQASAAAIDELPGDVTLALAPYGAGVELTAQRARERGHEILLQAPMEPFDYTQNNPGPHTLLTSKQSGEAIDDLHWLMSRFPGYAGVMNFLGARFTADEQALAPVFAELAERGLFFVDDGTSPQSLAAAVASKRSLPFAHVDVVLDLRQTPQAVAAEGRRYWLRQRRARDDRAALEFRARLGAARRRPRAGHGDSWRGDSHRRR
jgi:polysaccharide deacetylase 2 family uncharacterized protein YibQ